MTSRRQLDQHRHSLAEIRNIMNAMKNLAYMETRKLDRFLDAQYAVVRGIEAVAADFVTAFPDALPAAQAGNRAYLLVGSAPTATAPDSLAWCSRYPLIEAQAKAYVRASQTRLILQPIAEQLLA